MRQRLLPPYLGCYLGQQSGFGFLLNPRATPTHRMMMATAAAATASWAAAAPLSARVPVLSRAATARRLLLALPRPPPPFPYLATPLPRWAAAGLCDVAHAVKPGAGSGSDALLKGVRDKTVVEAVKIIMDMATRASSRREILHSDFLTPPVLKESMLALEKLAGIKAVAQGGYPQAERCRLSVGHPEIMTNDPDVVAALSISGNFGFEPCSHGDFLGAILGTGIVREKLGDILLQGEKGAHVLVVPELVDFFISALDKVGNVPVSCTQIPLLALEYEPPRTKSFKTVESSLRVDAVASAGFKISRSKLVDLISDGDVRLNWSPVVKNGATINTGDIVSIIGKGRLKIGEIRTTKKGKYAVELIRYL